MSEGDTATGMHIRSMTLSYDGAEDRIQLAVLLTDERKVSLWLTQRLARSLARALASYVEKTEGIPLSTVRDAMLSHEQASAVAGIRPSAPVQAASGPVHLVANVKIQQTPEKIAMTFEAGEGIDPRVVLEKTLVRQWMDMLHRQFRTAGWPEDVWPGWITGAGTSEGVTRH